MSVPSRSYDCSCLVRLLINSTAEVIAWYDGQMNINISLIMIRFRTFCAQLDYRSIETLTSVAELDYRF